MRSYILLLLICTTIEEITWNFEDIPLSIVTPASINPAGGFMYGCPYVMCTNGRYTFDTRGCRVCSFTPNTGQINHPGGDPFHQGGAQIGYPSAILNAGSVSSSPNYTKPCIPGNRCEKLSCPHGYYNGPGGCQFCICAKPIKTNTNYMPLYTKPCPSAPSSCDLPCKDGYTTGPGGCQHCSCKGMTSQAPTMSPEDTCLAKMTECQLTHPHGFMINPECDTCVDKDEVYIASNVTIERQPKVLLSNPCIHGFDLCMIVCETGYKTGPKLCQYCACKE